LLQVLWIFPTNFIKVRTYPLQRSLKNKLKPVYGKIKNWIQIITYASIRLFHCNNFKGLKIFCIFWKIEPIKFQNNARGLYRWSLSMTPVVLVAVVDLSAEPSHERLVMRLYMLEAYEAPCESWSDPKTGDGCREDWFKSRSQFLKDITARTEINLPGWTYGVGWPFFPKRTKAGFSKNLRAPSSSNYWATRLWSSSLSLQCLWDETVPVRELEVDAEYLSNSSWNIKKLHWDWGWSVACHILRNFSSSEINTKITG